MELEFPNEGVKPQKKRGGGGTVWVKRAPFCSGSVPVWNIKIYNGL